MASTSLDLITSSIFVVPVRSHFAASSFQLYLNTKFCTKEPFCCSEGMECCQTAFCCACPFAWQTTGLLRSTSWREISEKTSMKALKAVLITRSGITKELLTAAKLFMDRVQGSQERVGVYVMTLRRKF